MAAACLGLLFAVCGKAAPAGDFVARFASPPPQFGPSGFWWWFGAPYSDADIRASLDDLKAAGLGGFRIYPVYAFPGAAPPPEVRNAPYLSPAFLDLVGEAVAYGRSIGLLPETMLTSGWPYGGRLVPRRSSKVSFCRLGARFS